jgi:tagatose-6-phosphate ketose/aldose isomerase
VVAVGDSTLGFRHGPKSILNAKTLVVILLSNDGYARAYDTDLLHELEREGRAGAILVLGGRADGASRAEKLIMPGMSEASDLELAPLFVLVAQSYALLQSLALGLTPDRTGSLRHGEPRRAGRDHPPVERSGGLVPRR